MFEVPSCDVISGKGRLAGDVVVVDRPIGGRDLRRSPDENRSRWQCVPPTEGVPAEQVVCVAVGHARLDFDVVELKDGVGERPAAIALEIQVSKFPSLSV